MRLKSILSFFFLALILGSFSLSVMAQDTPPVPPTNRLYLASLTAVRYNPLGVETQNRLMYSRRLMDSTSVLFRDTYIAVGPYLKLNPAYLKVGPVVEVQPIAVFNLRAGYEFVRYFGTFGILQSYTESDAAYSDAERADTEDNAYVTNGHHIYIEPMLQMKIGNIAARTKFGIEYWKVDLHGSDDYFYDQTLDTLVPNETFFFTNDSDLLYMNGRLTVGLRFSGVFPGTESSHMRLGPLFAWSFNTDDYTSFNKPTLLCILGWYLDHPNRVGPMPYILVGFSFTSDFLNSGQN